jgi:5-methylcytosine-specific restriction endonuclease McrA
MKLSDLNILDVGDKIGMTGAVFSNNDGTVYLCMFPTQPSPDRNKIEPLEMDLADWQKFLKQLDVQETEVLVKDKTSGELVKAILRKSQRTIEQRVSWKVFERDFYHCRYCGAGGVPLTVDHLVLWEEGGPSTEDNLLSADRCCNKARGNLSYEAWLQSPYYKRVSRNLPMAVVEANEKLIPTLKLIPRRYSERSIRK